MIGGNSSLTLYFYPDTSGDISSYIAGKTLISTNVTEMNFFNGQ